MSYVLYRLFSASGELLYVGATKNINSRLRAHAAAQPWWRHVCHRSTALEWYDDPTSLAEAERAAIGTEEPVFNIDGREHARQSHYSGKGGRHRVEADPPLAAALREASDRRKQKKRLYQVANADLKSVVLEARAAGIPRSRISKLTGIAVSIIQTWD